MNPYDSFSSESDYATPSCLLLDTDVPITEQPIVSPRTTSLIPLTNTTDNHQIEADFRTYVLDKVNSLLSSTDNEILINYEELRILPTPILLNFYSYLKKFSDENQKLKVELKQFYPLVPIFFRERMICPIFCKKRK